MSGRAYCATGTGHFRIRGPPRAKKSAFFVRIYRLIDFDTRRCRGWRMRAAAFTIRASRENRSRSRRRRRGLSPLRGRRCRNARFPPRCDGGRVARGVGEFAACCLETATAYFAPSSCRSVLMPPFFFYVATKFQAFVMWRILVEYI